MVKIEFLELYLHEFGCDSWGPFKNSRNHSGSINNLEKYDLIIFKSWARLATCYKPRNNVIAKFMLCENAHENCQGLILKFSQNANLFLLAQRGFSQGRRSP